ncbi:MAG: hypothetical protein IJO27_01435 [Bacilli bacterium]|nr:hypothetical protein [Bacilli bacterium]
MNKVLKSLVVGGLGLMMLPGMVKADVGGEPLNSPGSSSANAYVNSIDESETFHVSIYWGDLQYDYVKQTDSVYAWVPVNEEGNYIIVDNMSTFAINADVSWNASIEGTSASFEGHVIDYDNYVCQSIYYANQPYEWNESAYDENGVLVNNQYSKPLAGDQTTLIYTDDACSTEVVEGTEFAEGLYYGYTPSFTAFGGSSVSLESMQSADWDMWIVGGEKSAVEEALAGDKVIGTFTVTISEALGDEG